MTMRKRFYNKGKAAELLPQVLINRTEIRGTASLSAHWLNCKKLLGSNKFAQLKSFGKEKEPRTEQRTVFTCRLALICFICPLHEMFTITSVVKTQKLSQNDNGMSFQWKVTAANLTKEHFLSGQKIWQDHHSFI